MFEFVKSITVFIFITTVFGGIISNEKYKTYFDFISGLIIILLVISPVVSFLNGDEDLYRNIQSQLFNADMTDAKREIKIAEGSFGDMVRNGLEEDIERTILQMGKKHDIDICEVDIELDNEETDVKVDSAVIRLKEGGEYSKKNIGMLKKDICDYLLIGKEKISICG